MNDFLPCPFETEPHYPHVFVDERHGRACGDYWVAKVMCNTCEIMMTAVGDTKDEAIEKVRKQWNTRYKETCTVEPVMFGLEEDDYEGYWCSNCGELSIDDIPQSGEPNYCPWCGGEVVDNDRA